MSSRRCGACSTSDSSRSCISPRLRANSSSSPSRSPRCWTPTCPTTWPRHGEPTRGLLRTVSPAREAEAEDRSQRSPVLVVGQQFHLSVRNRQAGWRCCPAWSYMVDLFPRWVPSNMAADTGRRHRGNRGQLAHVPETIGTTGRSAGSSPTAHTARQARCREPVSRMLAVSASRPVVSAHGLAFACSSPPFGRAHPVRPGAADVPQDGRHWPRRRQ